MAGRNEAPEMTDESLAGSELSLEDDLESIAAKQGQIVVVPGPRDIFVDIDSAYDFQACMTLVDVANSRADMSIEVVSVHPSKSGLPRRHVYLRTDRDLEPMERIALQAALGSDRKRELLSIARLLSGTARPASVFFEAEGFNDPRLLAEGRL